MYYYPVLRNHPLQTQPYQKLIRLPIFKTWAETHGYSFHFFQPGIPGSAGSTSGSAPGADKYEPVVHASWRSSIVWCNAYTELSGLTPVYRTSTNEIIRTCDTYNASSATALCDTAIARWDADGYRLPSAGEWQFTARYKNGSTWTPGDYLSGGYASAFSIVDINPANGYPRWQGQ